MNARNELAAGMIVRNRKSNKVYAVIRIHEGDAACDPFFGYVGLKVEGTSDAPTLRRFGAYRTSDLAAIGHKFDVVPGVEWHTANVTGVPAKPISREMAAVLLETEADRKRKLAEYRRHVEATRPRETKPTVGNSRKLHLKRADGSVACGNRRQYMITGANLFELAELLTKPFDSICAHCVATSTRLMEYGFATERAKADAKADALPPLCPECGSSLVEPTVPGWFHCNGCGHTWGDDDPTDAAGRLVDHKVSLDEIEAGEVRVAINSTACAKGELRKVLNEAADGNTRPDSAESVAAALRDAARKLRDAADRADRVAAALESRNK